VTQEAEDTIQTPGHYGLLSLMAKSSAAENPAILEVNNCQSGRKPEDQLRENTRHIGVFYCLLVIVCVCPRWMEVNTEKRL